MFIKLEQSIKELHEMFMDIAMLIENQGEMVNRSNIDIVHCGSTHKLINKMQTNN